MEHQDTNRCYTLSHLSQITGLTDRTLRSYLAKGILQGEKKGGVWRFTEAQIDAFLRHPAVRPGIRAKNNAIVYDFLLDSKKPEPRICVVLDLPDADLGSASAFFCSAITGGSFHDLRFSFDGIEAPRIILSGHPDELLPLVNSYNSSR